MEIRDWAEQLLFEPDLESKLADPGPLTDDRPGTAIIRPDAPARSPAIRFRAQQNRARVPFPKATDLETDHARGVVLHFFANHELLALELMALVLLRCPDAPAAFRAGLCGIMRDEQRHMTFYLERMRTFGVGFGDLPVNDYFWTCISTVETPRQFNARMALTFEQANLDYAVAYAQAFGAVGDVETGQVLEAVLADEIRHVAHGLHWFEAERDRDTPLFDDWQAALEFPLTPIRAKGRIFAEEPRRAAGLPQSYIDRLRVYHYSRGRPPTVWAFNPDCEAQVAAGGGFTANRAVRQLTAELSPLQIFGISVDDAVVVPAAPDPVWLRSLQALEFELPEIIVAADLPSAARALEGRKIGGLRPWGWGPVARSAWAPICEQAGLGVPTWPLDLFSKSHMAEHFAEYAPEADPEDAPRIVRSIDEVVEAARAHVGITVVKAPLGSSGRNTMRIAGETTEAQTRWMARQLAGQGALLIRPWRDGIADLSCLFEVSDAGTRVLGHTRFLTDARGAYRGAVLGCRTAGLSTPVLRYLSRDGRSPRHVEATLSATAHRVGAGLHARGFRGRAGIDGLVYRHPDGSLRLNSLLEINPRQTMGHLALALERRLAHGSNGLWIHIHASEAEHGFPALAARLEARLPTQTISTPVTHIRQGVVCTTDPQAAEIVWTALLVARTTATVVGALRAVGLDSIAELIEPEHAPIRMSRGCHADASDQTLICVQGAGWRQVGSSSGKTSPPELGSPGLAITRAL